MDAKRIRKIGVVGAGTIGSSWVTLFIMKHYTVNLFDVMPEVKARAIERIHKNLRFLADKELIGKRDVEPALNRINKVDSIAEAVKNVDFVQESVAEDYDIKKAVFQEMDAASEASILSSSSSGLLMTEIQKVTKSPGRCVIAHPFNPPHLVPLVEIVGGEKTSQETIEVTRQLMLQLGKVPVILRAEIPGYLANRLALALWREAIDLVDRGVASVEDVDKAIYAGPGIRWALMGPHLIYHLGGGPGGIEHHIDMFRDSFKPIWESMSSWSWLSDSMKVKLIEGVKSELHGRTWEDLAEWRDDKLVKLLKVVYTETDFRR